MIPTLLGIDLGTSGVKAVALSTVGEVLAAHVATYDTQTPRPGWSEQDPSTWWTAVAGACRSALAEAEALRGERPEVIGIGLSGQMHTIVLLGADGHPLRPAITWMDTRAEPLLPMVRDTIATAGLGERLANPVVLGLSLLPLVWLRRHEPETLRAAWALLLAKDYLRFRLTGERGAEPTDASATLLCDVGARAWLPEVMAAFDLPLSLLSPMGESTAVAGTLTPAAARHLGLQPGVPVAFGAADASSAAIGMGTLRPDQLQLMVGTGAQALAVRDRPAPDPAGRLHAFCHVRGWVSQASVNNAGSALAWARTRFGLGWEHVYTGLGSDPTGPLFVPYLTGERTPPMKGHARGAWLGLTPDHTAHDLARASGEGVVASIAEAVGTVTAARPPEGPLRAAGGGMRHAGFAQAIADATGHAVEVREVRDASGVGAALLAGVAAAAFDLDAAARSAPARTAASYEPDPARTAWWAERRQLLRTLDAIGFHEVVARRSGA